MHTPESEVATGFALQSSYSLPFHARSASWWLSRFGPVAPHFGQTPWNCFLGIDEFHREHLSAERTQPSLVQLSAWPHDFQRHMLHWSDSAPGIPLSPAL